ncbi:MAG: DUF4194 domain-containing protein [Candidatus Nanopelagicales bacterium]
MPEPTIGEAAVPLLKGIVYAQAQPTAWSALLALPAQVRDHLAVLGLDVHIDEVEGYAFVRQREVEGGDERAELPRLVSRHQLSFRVSLMLALLRRALLEFDAQGDQTRLVITREDAVGLVGTYHPARNNEARLADEVESDLRRIVDLGFLRSMRDQPHTYEVMRVIKAFVDAQWLADFDARLAEYTASPEPGEHRP